MLYFEMLFIYFRALEMGLLSQDQVDQCDPALMFTIPRLAIVAGLLIFPHGPLSLFSPDLMSDMFRPFRVHNTLFNCIPCIINNGFNYFIFLLTVIQL